MSSGEKNGPPTAISAQARLWCIHGLVIRLIGTRRAPYGIADRENSSGPR